MTRDEVLDRLRTARAAFDDKLAAIPAEAMDIPTPGGAHSPKEIVAHVAAYDELIVERLSAARRGETTAFDRDRVGWEAFNERIWAEAREKQTADVFAHAEEVFWELLGEVAALSDDELATPSGATATLDPAWLGDRQVWELVAIDGYDHYPMHFSALEAAATGAP